MRKDKDKKASGPPRRESGGSGIIRNRFTVADSEKSVSLSDDEKRVQFQMSKEVSSSCRSSHSRQTKRFGTKFHFYRALLKVHVYLQVKLTPEEKSARARRNWATLRNNLPKVTGHSAAVDFSNLGMYFLDPLAQFCFFFNVLRVCSYV